MIYQPQEDSYLLEKYVKKLSKGKKVLDLGAGSGIQSIAALSSGAKKVLTVEVDKESISHCKNLGINCVKSDLFSNIKGKFDLIVFNPPYLPEDNREDLESKRATTGGKKGDEVILKFLKQAKKHLEDKGKILIIVSSLTPKDNIIKLLEKLKMKEEVLESESFFMEKLEVWEIIS